VRDLVMTARARGDVIVAVAALVIAVGYWLLAREIPESLLGDSVGATGLPNVYAGLLAFVALLLMVQAWRAPREVGGRVARDTDDGYGAMQHLRAIGLLVPAIAYLVLIGYLGYAVSVGLLILAVALYSGARFGWPLVAISIVGAIGLWITFVLLFNVPLPSGSLWQALSTR
jgi:putative tricarboxylic transport membrane protein